LRQLFVIFLFLVCKSFHTKASPLFFNHHQVEQGLSNNTVFSSIQDRAGFMWFGTKDGLNRFDGYSFKILRQHPNQENGLSSNFIRSLYEDRKGIIWVGTDRGLSLFNPRTETFSSFHPAIYNEVIAIQEDLSGNVWFISGLHLYKFIPKTKRLESFPPENYFEATALCISASGVLWVAANNGTINAYDIKKNDFEAFNIFSSSPPVSSQLIS